MIDETLELFMDLDASDEQLDCPLRICIRQGRFCKERTG